MAAMTQVNLMDTISWDFELISQGSVVKYGHIGAQYYKVYLPGNLYAPTLHPIKTITQALFNHARRELTEGRGEGRLIRP